MESAEQRWYRDRVNRPDSTQEIIPKKIGEREHIAYFHSSAMFAVYSNLWEGFDCKVARKIAKRPISSKEEARLHNFRRKRWIKSLAARNWEQRARNPS